MEQFLTFGIVGLSTAAIYAIIGSGLVLTYTTTGVFNFAQGAAGMMAAFCYWQLVVGWGWPVPISLVIVLLGLAPGLRRPSSGRVFLDGRDVTKTRPAGRARRGLARTFQRLELFGRLSVRDNLLVAAELGPDPRRAAKTVAEILVRLDLGELADAAPDTLPTGVGRLVEVGRALAIRPKVLLLDEPAAGQDAAETERFATLLRALAADGTAVVLVEHDMSLVMCVCDEVHVLDLGKVIAVGPPETIRNDETVLAAYLGAA